MDQGKYNQEYYLRNKKKLLNKRKDMYQTDEGYRKRAVQARQRFRDRKKALLGKYVLRNYKGKSVRVLKIGKVLVQLNISRSSIVHWEEIGLVPESLNDFGISRCYTDHQVKILKAISEDVKKEKTEKYLLKKYRRKINSTWLKGL